MRIRDRQIGQDAPPYVIAEIGVNHDGSVERAIELVEAADSAGADAVKLQLFRTDLLMSGASKLAAYQAAAGETDPIEMLRRLELSAAQMRPVMERAHDLGLHAIVTVFSVDLVAEAERVVDACGGWDAYKSASPDIINRPLLEAMAATGRPLIVSTGASTMEEVRRAVGWLGSARDRLALLQCVSSYPVPEGQDGLGGIGALREAFPDIPVGYSDHTDRVETSGLAVACGASLLEKHLTYDKTADGPDHLASATREELCEYVRCARLGADPGSVVFHAPRDVVERPCAARSRWWLRRRSGSSGASGMCGTSPGNRS
ncbi:MAG: N-acetylneuraminate synthase family protein [Phycisphaerales bacterium]|nr:N-acetylneuraminate synthase family protein [Phycisphaerales bacterium]